MKKSILLFLTLITLVACKSKNEPDTFGEEVPLNVDNTVAYSMDNRVIYEMNLYNFTKEGTLAAAEARLAELRTLGIDIVWLMPIQPRSQQGKIGSLGSPYALHDYTAVNSHHGTMDDFQSFVNSAHALGMEVWLDWVPNHTGLDHVWVTEHPDYYQHSGGQIVHPNNYSDVYQLDYSNPDMCAAMQQAMIYWITNADVDGFRCDYVSSPQIPAEFWEATIPMLQEAAGRKIWMLGEADFADKSALYKVGFDYDYAWGFHDRVKLYLGTTDAAGRLQAQCQTLLNNGNYTNMDRMVYLTNHDDIGDNFSENYFGYHGDNVAPLTVVEFTLYGMPLLYNGQEIGYKKVQNYFNRDIIYWGNPNKQLQNTIRTLVALRHTQPALAGGKKADRPTTTFLKCSNSAFMAYTKVKDDNMVLVVINLADKMAECDIQGIAEGIYVQCLNSETIADRIVQRDVQFTSTTHFELPKKGYAVFVKR